MAASIRGHLKLEEIGYMIPLSYPVKEIPIVTIFVKMYLKSQLDEFHKLFKKVINWYNIRLFGKNIMNYEKYLDSSIY